MKIAKIETLSCSAGWRNYYFVKLTTESGIVGWSEFDEGFGSPGVGTVINSLGPRVIGQSVHDHEPIYSDLFACTRPGAGGVVGQGLGAIENAILDAKAKDLGVPCYSLLGGKMRDAIRVYWSHCATWRISQPNFYPPAINSLDDVEKMGREVREKGFTGLKTNLFLYDKGSVRGWGPGFSSPFSPALNVERNVLENLAAHLNSFRKGAGSNMDILIDLNFNAKTEGYLKIIREIENHDIFWVEIDSRNPEALAHIRRESRHPISSCETLIGLGDFLPYFRAEAVDIAIIDTIWNGAWQSMKIASAADAHEINVAPHNFYGHLCSMINAHFATAVPNLRIMEIDIDRIAWDNDLFTHTPTITDGHLILGDEPGWGTEPIEEALLRHPPLPAGGLTGRPREIN